MTSRRTRTVDQLIDLAEPLERESDRVLTFRFSLHEPPPGGLDTVITTRSRLSVGMCRALGHLPLSQLAGNTRQRIESDV